MRKFEISKEFLLDGEEFKIISGAIHYFRISESHWEESLYNLKALGCNTVETYVPWNIHEPEEGKMYFEGNANLLGFLDVAKKLGLYVILRPTPYICAEWEFGGLPGWLLKYKDIRFRTSDPDFIEKVENYYKELIPMVVPYQIDHGGNILMMQVENEYGSYGNDKDYLNMVADLMRKYGVTVPLFTSDGGWQEALEAGSLIENDIMPTANFGSKTEENFNELKTFMSKNNKEYPLMCMEFWDGWFNRYNEKIIRRDGEDVANEVEKLYDMGSFNFYMFQGGTNFGFMNGCSARLNNDLPQVTSYDYDALLTEWGDPTDKYFKVQEVLKSKIKDWQFNEPKVPTKKAYGTFKLSNKVSLINTLDKISEKHRYKYTVPMEELDQYYGYILYSTNIKSEGRDVKARLVRVSDRAHVFLNGEKIFTAYKKDFDGEFVLNLKEGNNKIDILVENMGRVNYGERLQNPEQYKGIRGGLKVDIHFQSDWDIYNLELKDIDSINYESEWKENTPAFYEYEVEISDVNDTFLDTRNFGKGVAFVNGINIGRFWNVGPHGYLYIPRDFLKEGKNTITVFETEGVYSEEISLLDHPVYIDIKE